MFDKDELAIIAEVLSSISFKAGQSGIIAKVEGMLEKIAKEIKPEDLKKPEENK